MSQVKFQKLIDDFSSTSLAEVFKSHDFFKFKQNSLTAFDDKQFIDFLQIGDFDLEDNTNVVVICARSLAPLNERASRKAQYDLGKKILKNFQTARAGIFVYYDSKGDFRMSLIYADYVGTKVNYSTFRRFTYFVSKQQKNVTFLQQVASLKFTSFKELKELFSVEKVTKEFFKKYRNLFLELLDDFKENNEFQNVVVDTGISTTSDFVKKMMGQIVFLYFVQKKGWLGVRPGENWGSGDQVFLRTLFTACEKSNKNYFNEYLEPLFYQALAEKRDDDLFKNKDFNCRIPFLNGGLFESVYDWKNTEINIHNEVLGKLLDFFDQYNFTVDENTPSDQEISVDPEMLGKIFENLLEVKDRKDKGAFYTPREIVHYMCQESLIQYLVSEDAAPEDRIRKIFETKNTDLSVLIDDNKKAEAIKKMQELKDIADKVDIALRNVKIVDPAVGSGAFPMGMLNELSSVRHYLNTNFLHKTNETGKELSLYDIKKETLENCIYAVDLDPGAVEIAKLRFWLALIVEFESNDPKIAPPVLPNLDYKIMQGNSLLEEYEGVKLFDENIIKIVDTGKEKLIEDIKKKQLALEKEYLDLHAKDKLTQLKKDDFDNESKNLRDQLKKLTKIEKVDIEVQSLFDFDKHKETKLKADKLKSLQKEFFETNNKDNKESIKKQIERLEWELIEATLVEQDKISELVKIEEFKKSKTKPFFLWKLHFADVFEQKGGFDITIGNPPYVQLQKAIEEGSSKKYADLYKDQDYETFERSGDIYSLFYEQGINFLKKETGVLCYITSNKWMRTSYGESLRKFFLSKNPLLLIDLGPGIFETAMVDTNILLIKNHKNLDQLKAIFLSNDYMNEGGINNYTKNNFHLLKNLNSSPWSIGNEIDHKLKEKIEKNGRLLKNWDITINYGIKTGYNKAFIIDSETKELLCQKDPRSIEALKPVLGGSNLEKYTYNWAGDWLIFIPWHFPLHKDKSITGSSKKAEEEFIKQYPAIYDHLYKFKDKLSARNKAETGIRYEWYALQRCAATYYEEFGKEKIVWLNLNRKWKYSFAGPDIFVEASLNFISTNEYAKLLVGVLSSSIHLWYFKKIGRMHDRGGYMCKIDTISAFPVPVINESNANLKDKMEKLVDQILTLKKQNKDADTKNLEHQIDKLVYKLYDLTPEEIEIVENSSKK